MPVPARPPREGFWRYAVPAKWTQFVVPMLAVGGLLFDIVALSDAAGEVDSAEGMRQTAIAVLYTFGLILLPYAVTWAAAMLIMTAFVSLPFAPPDVPASTLVLAIGFVVALTPPAFIVAFTASITAWAAILVALDLRHGAVAVIVVVGAAASGSLGAAVRRVLVDRAESGERARRLRAELLTAASEQRRFIAHELHDVVAHHITVIRMVANMGMRGDGPVGRDLLETVGQSAATALAELRRLLDVLDPAEPNDAVSDGGDRSELDRHIDRISSELRTVGVAVHTDVAPAADVDIPDTHVATLERILIEATTNVLKHAGDTTDCRIRLVAGPDAVVLEVSNRTVDVPTRPAGEPSGYGVPGMQLRAAELGGSVEAGELAGRWIVRATLPLPR